MTIARKGQSAIHRAPRRIRRTALLLSLLAVLPGTSGALDLEYDVGLSLKYGDNLSLTEDNEVSDTVLSPVVRFTAEEDSSHIKLQARGDLFYPIYLQNNFDDDFRGKFSGTLDWMIVPDRFDWVFQDYFSPQQIDELDSYSPDNVQQVNLFVTGPTLYARFGAATRGQFDLRYGNSWAETSEDFNGDRYGAAARVRHDIDAVSYITGNLEGADINYDPEGERADYKRYDAYVGYGRKGPQLSFDVDLGYTELDRDISPDKDSGALVRARADWRFSSRSLLGLTARYQYTDATQNLVTPTFDFSNRDLIYLAYPDILVQPEVYRERMGKLVYQYKSERTTFRVQPYYRSFEYLDDLAEDQVRAGALFDVDYRLRPLTTLSFLAGYENRDYDDTDREDDNLVVGVGLEQQFTRHWIGRFDYEYLDRDSNEAGRSYEANSVTLTVIYRR
ncbi:outer membrane beta-barrel protein [Lysobacter niastensis]|uniref:Outer membrane beta-barrel protein n=1 Tax=Lysobacter niastensis TaxID=380629 RepID=A0ABS0BBC8_9GAMM|nr:outer membrane beta-barrel protein [Lysobacter niastensis]MBF6024314.1 outer membrane beta-barrel protein [Lysobacter niastensis]